MDVRGRSKTLRVNYRTSHQIREQADRLLGPDMTDVDGNREDRRHTVSVFNGPPPEIRTFSSEREESEALGSWLRSLARARDRLSISAVEPASEFLDDVGAERSSRPA